MADGGLGSKGSRWRVERVSASAEAVHGFWPAPGDHLPLLRVVDVLNPAVVLGSSTPVREYSVEAIAAGGYEVVRRGSGGGAVVVTPGDQLWLMLYLGSHDRLVSVDLGHSFIWLGELLQGAISRTAGLELEVVTERQPPNESARIACFAGLGFGELHASGRKVLGLSQRRSQGVACLQASLLFKNRQAELAGFARTGFSVPNAVGLAELCDLRLEPLTEAIVSAIASR